MTARPRRLTSGAERLAGAGGGLVLLAILVGCMSFNFGTHATELVSPEGPGRQCGTINVPGRQELDVYYPIPYASPSNLVTADSDDVAVVEQKPDHFRVRNPHLLARDVTWTARGVLIAPSGGPLPAEPVPVPR